jgi:aminoglycoside N3'-acetyltransferase
MTTPFETACQLIDELVEPGTHLMVHSSLEAIGGWDAQPHDLVKYLLDRLGSEGCLLMPTHTSTTPVEAYILSDPIYDPVKTMPRTGALPVFFMRYFSPKRSLHPWLSVAALGQDDEFYIRDHHSDPLPLGKQSPYYRLCQHPRGRVLLLGVSHSNNAINHVHENLIYPYYPYKIYQDQDAIMRYRDRDGEIRTMQTRVPLRPPYPNFNKWGKYLEEGYPQVFKKPTLSPGYEVMLVDAPAFLNACIEEYNTSGLCLYHPRFTSYPSPWRRWVMAIKRRLGLPPLLGK